MRECPTFCPCENLQKQQQEFIIDGTDFMVRGDADSCEVRLHAYADRGCVTLVIAHHTGSQSISLEQTTFEALLDHLNTTK